MEMECRVTKESWDLHGDGYNFQKYSNLGVSGCMWGSRDIQNEDLSCMFDETTPVKDCGDFDFHVNDHEYMKKAPEGSNETLLQMKRRRMLQFADETLDPPFQSEDIFTSFLKSKVDCCSMETLDSIDDVLPNVSEWESGFQEDISLDRFEGLDQAESWLTDCFNDIEMFGNSEENSAGASDGQNDHTGAAEGSSIQSHSNVIVVQPRAVRATRSIVLKGKKTYIKTYRNQTSSTSSVVYPFTFIKPCGGNGDVTLKDINQKIHSPQPKLKLGKEDAYESYPTSAFSGKPVVGKTKIRTEGGKGSITITRTKG